MTKDELLLFLCKQTAQIPMGYDPKIYSILHLARWLTEKTYDSELYKKCDREAIAEFEQFQRDFDEEWRREEAERIGNR